MNYKLKLCVYIELVLGALVLEQLVKGLAGALVALAIYLPSHNWFWGRV